MSLFVSSVSSSSSLVGSGFPSFERFPRSIAPGECLERLGPADQGEEWAVACRSLPLESSLPAGARANVGRRSAGDEELFSSLLRSRVARLQPLLSRRASDSPGREGPREEPSERLDLAVQSLLDGRRLSRPERARSFASLPTRIDWILLKIQTEIRARARRGTGRRQSRSVQRLRGTGRGQAARTNVNLSSAAHQTFLELGSG